MLEGSIAGGRTLSELTRLAAIAPDPLLAVDEFGTVVIANDFACALLGYPNESLAGKRVVTLVTGGVATPGAATAIHRDGTRIPISLAARPVEIEGRRHVVASLHDMTERHHAEESFRDLLDSAPDAMIIADRRGRIVLVNTRFESLFGYDRSEIIGKPIELLVPARLRDAHVEHREKYGRSPSPRAMGSKLELHGVRKNGDEFPVEVSLAPLRTGGGLVASAIRDATERKEIELQLTEANRLKTEFLANVSHELRTPLNAIIGFSELLYRGKAGSLSDRQHEFVGDVLTSARHLLELINGVLDLAKVEAGKMDFFYEPVDLAVLVAETRDALRPLADAKGQQLELRLEPDVGEVVLDRGRVKQVLFNYLSNAIKFTGDGGRITLRVAPEGDAAIRIDVADTGDGIPKHLQASLFVAFQQLDATSAKRHQGTGLGLALTKRIVEGLGGSIAFVSEPGVGSTFSAVLPRRFVQRPTTVRPRV